MCREDEWGENADVTEVRGEREEMLTQVGGSLEVGEDLYELVCVRGGRRGGVVEDDFVDVVVGTGACYGVCEVGFEKGGGCGGEEGGGECDCEGVGAALPGYGVDWGG